MTTPAESDPRPTLPDLERSLVRAAARTSPRRAARRRWGMPLAFAALLGATAVAGAATGVIDVSGGTEVERGHSPSGAYVIRVKPESKHPHPGGELCLQLEVADTRPAYGCGSVPTQEAPFGVVIADALDDGPQRIIYGLVTEEIATVALLGEGDQHTIVDTAEKPGLPGRFFSILAPGETIAPNGGRIELVGYAASGEEVARIGSRQQPAHKPLSHGEAVAQGDPAGFAPTAVPARAFHYEGAEIEPARAEALGLICVEAEEVRCFDSIEEVNERTGGLLGSRARTGPTRP